MRSDMVAAERREFTQHAGGVSDNAGVGFEVVQHDSTHADHRAGSDASALSDDRTRACFNAVTQSYFQKTHLVSDFAPPPAAPRNPGTS